MAGPTLAELEADLASVQSAISALQSGGLQTYSAFGRSFQGFSLEALYAERRRLRGEIQRHAESRADLCFTEARPFQ